MRTESDKIESGYWNRYCAILPDTLLTILELGVDEGLSLELWVKRYPKARVVGVDNRLCPTVEGAEQVIADQTDRSSLEQLSNEVGGWGLVVDDASHLGSESATSFDILWPYVHPGGYYVVEDWMTGYWSWWPDGPGHRDGATDDYNHAGHQAGMVGFVKRLVDLLADPSWDVESVAFYPGQVFVQKRA